METVHLWGVGIGGGVAAGVWQLARVWFQINDNEDWLLWTTWLGVAAGWTAFCVVLYVAELGLL